MRRGRSGTARAHANGSGRRTSTAAGNEVRDVLQFPLPQHLAHREVRHEGRQQPVGEDHLLEHLHLEAILHVAGARLLRVPPQVLHLGRRALALQANACHLGRHHFVAADERLWLLLHLHVLHDRVVDFPALQGDLRAVPHLLLLGVRQELGEGDPPGESHDEVLGAGLG